MPRGDKTGPWGAGAMTGRGMGLCAGYSTPGYMNPGFNPRSRGNSGFGRGMGRGNRWRFYATGQPGWARERDWDNMSFSPAPNMDSQQKMDEREEIRYLIDQTKTLRQMLEEITSRIDGLSKANDK